MSYTLNARLLGLVLAIVLGWGGAALLPSHASADIGVDLDLTGSEDDEGILEIDLDSILETDDSTEAEADLVIDVDLTDESAEADADTDASVEIDPDDANVLEPVAGLLDDDGDDIGDLDSTVDDVVDTAEPAVDPLADA